MNYYKISMLSFFLLLSQASSFSPHQATNDRAPTALHYVDDPAHIAGYKKSSPTKVYKLHSNNISQLTGHSTADDVMKAMKRAQNLKDHRDINTIGKFLLEGVDDSFAYGYKGSLLARFAVAALRLNEFDIAQEAIQMRKERFASSMTPFESAAIVRGMLRMHKTNQALDLLEEELSIEEDDKDRLKHRALSLASITSRHLFENEPRVAIQACKMLEEMGPVVQRAGLRAEDMELPWYRILVAADQCKVNTTPNFRNRIDKAVVGAMREFPLDPEFHEVFDRLASK